MASMVASKRIPLVRAMEKLLAASSGSALRPMAVTGGVRGYNAGAPLRRYERDESDVDSRRAARDVAVPGFFSGSQSSSRTMSFQRNSIHFFASRFDPVRPVPISA